MSQWTKEEMLAVSGGRGSTTTDTNTNTVEGTTTATTAETAGEVVVTAVAVVI